jgi:hypothetical protein
MTAAERLPGGLRKSCSACGDGSNSYQGSRHVKSILLATAVIGGLAFSAPATRAGVITYDTVAAFNAATTGLTLYQIPAPATGNNQVAPSILIGPVTFADSLVLHLYNDGLYGAGQHYLATGGVETLTLSGATAIGFDLGMFAGAGSFTAAVNGGAPITVTAPGLPSHGFFGITDTDPITSIVFTTPEIPFVELDMLDFQVGSVASSTDMPEPASLALLGVGLAGLLAARRRMRPGAPARPLS